MKLLSMKRDGLDRTGIVIGEEVLDLTGFLEIIEQRGEWVEAEAQPPFYHHLEGAFKDALDVCKRGEEWVRDKISRFENDLVLADDCRKLGALKQLSSVRLNPPVIAPGKILAVGLNYAAHAAEQSIEPPGYPLVFSKCTSALVGPEDEIRLPRVSDHIDYEAELAVVIGKQAKSVSAATALQYVAGYTIMNDVTARDLQKRERQWTRAKGLDTFAPCGPWLVTKDEIADPHTLGVELRVNGEVRQKSNTSDLIFGIQKLIEFISEDLTLNPGDIISTGTPSGVGVYRQPPVYLKGGDVIEIEIDRIGKLRNPVASKERMKDEG
jgi:acylpyruvate hydrolase